MEQSLRSIAWEAPTHHHTEKGNDWYVAMIIVVISLIIAVSLFGNKLFAILIGVGGATLLISAAKKPSVIPYAVTLRGIRIDAQLYPYSTLESYRIDEEDPKGPQLLIKSDRKLMPLLVLPIPPEHIDDIDDIIKENLVEEELYEPTLVKILEAVGF
jgi:hypothetical protein